MPPTVLIADNDPAVSALLAEVVRRLGCHVVTASDGRQTLAILAREDVAVLVCDLDMPGACGQEVLQWSSRQPSPVPAIVVSGFVDAAVTAQLRALGGVRAVLRKPFDLAAFASAVRTLLAPPQGPGHRLGLPAPAAPGAFVATVAGGGKKGPASA